VAEMLTLRLSLPLWRRAVVHVWIRVLVIKEMLFPGSVDEDRATERMARFICRIKISG